jgi:hypothetical protein
VQVMGQERLPDDFRRGWLVENRYDFTNLNECVFEWQLARFPSAAENKSGHTVIAAGTMKGPNVGPHDVGDLKIKLPGNWSNADVLYLAVKDGAGRELWTWSWGLKTAAQFAGRELQAVGGKNQTHDEGGLLTVQTGLQELRFSKATGMLTEVRRNGTVIPFGNGPRFIAFRRNDRKYTDLTGLNSLTNFAWRNEDSDVLIEASYSGALNRVRWRVSSMGGLRLDYEYTFDGTVDMIGVQFDAPEKEMKKIRWLGHGPYRVWKNRMEGTRLDVWQNNYNDTTPGESWVYPEFKGYFRDWKWASFNTTKGRIIITSEADDSFLGVYKPKDGKDGLLDFPEIGIAFLDVVPAIRNKFHTTDEIGPQSRARQVSGVKRGRVSIRFNGQ